MQEQSEQIPSAKEVKAFAESDIGRQLISYFQKNDSPELQKAMQQASKGNFSQAKKIINQLLADPDAPELPRQR